MKIADHLSADMKKQLIAVSGQEKREVVKVEEQKRKETYSKWEWEEIMGTSRDTFKRVSGSIRRR